MTRAHGFGGQFSVATFGGGALLSVAVLASLAFQFLSPLRAPGACPPVFADEFDSARLDTARWNDTYPTGQAEQQAYVPEALSVSSGMLHISAAARPGDGLPYTSGTITTRGKFSQQYGYFEMRARVPQGQGLWPAFWLLHTGPLPWTEIDVFEILGHDPTTAYFSNHWHDDAGAHQSLTQPFTGPDFSGGFHIFGLNWTDTSLTWYVDGKPQAQTKDNVPREPMFLLANLAVGGVWPGYPDATTVFPAHLDIDYIRVYAPGCWPGPYGPMPSARS